jgi:hypothetical protein
LRALRRIADEHPARGVRRAARAAAHGGLDDQA